MELAYKKLSELKMDEDNPRIHPDSMLDKLCQSISRFGFIDPILTTEDLTIIAGHGRYKSATEEGLEEVPVVVLPLSNEKAKAYMLFDNKVPEKARWDMVQLGEILEELNNAIYDVTATGFDMDELKDILNKTELNGGFSSKSDGAFDDIDDSFFDELEEDLEEDLLEFDDEEEEEWLEEEEVEELTDEQKKERATRQLKSKFLLTLSKYEIKNPEEPEKRKKKESFDIPMGTVESKLLTKHLQEYNPELNSEGNRGFFADLLSRLGIEEVEEVDSE